MDLSVYWQCRKCSAGWDPDGGDESEHYICNGYRRKGETCPTCGPAAHLFEPYIHIELDLSSALPSLIARALESEHGDLGLASGAADKPPLPALGRALRDPREAVDSIAALVALFDAALTYIAARPPPTPDLGLTAVALAAPRYAGLPFDALERRLRSKMPPPGMVASRYGLDEVLRVNGSTERCVVPFHDPFFLYVKDGYNELLFWKNADEVEDGGAGTGVGGGAAAAEGGEEGGQGAKGEDSAWAGWGGS
ncbi:putative ankyrin repeat-containing protein [Neofusicoccum parvum UCRNP2]|uniref:Putative ankyrin repeat-containing protein n=1 Tax=Botryosphaeria parva (strain UCR-NP2) TaxID=1287680 RepID=R1G750_BOTPV|nr:putative ankyrin repeat-containing protein [Neofusicoccum parvum UCRNP2]